MASKSRGGRSQRRRRPRFVPSKLLHLLEENIPGFVQETYRHEIAWMLWEATNPRATHRHYPGALSFSHALLRSMFGKHSFAQINRYPRSRYFLPIAARNSGSSKDAYTKGYQPSVWMQKALHWAIKTPEMIEMVDRAGNTRRIESNAIRSTDYQGHRLRRWKGVTMPSLIRVDCEALRASLPIWQTLHDLSKRRDFDPTRLGAFGLKESSLPIALQQTMIFLGLAANPKHDHCVPIQYELHESGRLYAPGLNLQSCKRQVRQVALAGHWDADMSACHFAILTQMAKRVDVDCWAIDHYVREKRSVRLSIAQDLSIPVYTVKKLINALGYGARASTSPRAAIAKEIGAARAAKFFEHSLVHDLKRDIARASQAIIRAAPRRDGCLINLANRIALDPNRTQASLMAHLLQGVEAVALEAAVRTCAEHVVLLQHDGFTATKFIEPAMLRMAVLNETGYDLSFEVEPIISPMKAIKEHFCTKSEIDEKPNQYNGLDSFWPIHLSTLVSLGPEDVPPVYPLPLPEVEAAF